MSLFRLPSHDHLGVTAAKGHISRQMPEELMSYIVAPEAGNIFVFDRELKRTCHISNADLHFKNSFRLLHLNAFRAGIP